MAARGSTAFIVTMINATQPQALTPRIAARRLALNRAVLLLILSTWVIAASAQFFGRDISREQLEQMQRQRGAMPAMPTPTREEAAQMERESAEMGRLSKEIERLHRLGRYDEATVLSKRLDELMNSGPTARYRQQMMESLGDVMRQLPPGMLPEGFAQEDLNQALNFSMGDAINMERSMMEGEGAYLPEPLFVKPVVLHYADEMMSGSARIPMKARQFLMDGYARMQAKDYDGADAAFRQASQLTPSPQVVEARARLLVARGNPKAALRLLETFPNRNVSQLWLQSEIQSSLGAHPAAVETARRALKLASAGGDTGVEYASALNNLGVALQLAGEPQRALELYEKSVGALQAAVPGASQQNAQIFRMQLPAVASNLGLAFWQFGDRPRAVEAYRVALDERAYFENASDAFMTERVQLAKAQAVAVELHALISLDPESLGLQTLLERKGALLERRTRVQSAFRRDANAQVAQPGAIGRMFESPMTRAERDRGNRQRADDKDLLREYESVVQERAALTRTPSNTARIQDLDTRIQVMQQRMQMREAEGRNREELMSQRDLSTMMRESGNNPMRMNEAVQARMDQQQRGREQAAKDERASLFSRVRERVPQDAVLLEMVKYRPIDPKAPDAKRAERYGTYVIRAGAEPEYVDLGEAGPLEKLIGEFRTVLASPERSGARDLGRKLDEVLMRPVRAKIGAATTLYVAPEGSINLAPLSALVDEQGRFLLESYTINYLASGRDLLYLGRAEPARGPALIIADPAFDEKAASSPPTGGAQTRSRDFRSTKYDRLPGTATEAATLKKVLPDADVLTGTSATETAAKKVAGPRILHIATHGFFLQDLPGESEDPMLRSGLVFAGVNALSSAEDDGVLTALEASNLDLRGTKLVVLSACETGLGEVRNGEGVFGLRRAFVVAGAETLLMSLWQVADDATKDLMTSYYSRLSKGEPRAEALRQAQLAMLKDAKTAHPFFWAAFISSGESASLGQ
jgi:CHAT domain-containing protein/tetratricopeptide (TPR) repeat protein